MDLTKEQIIELIKSPEKILDVPTMEIVIDHCTTFIYEGEEDLSEQEFKCDVLLEKLVELHGSVAKGKVKLRLSPEYHEMKRLDRHVKALKAYRNNMRRKRDRLIPR